MHNVSTLENETMRVLGPRRSRAVVDGLMPSSIITFDTVATDAHLRGYPANKDPLFQL
jgi:hypothetical protein